MKIEDIGDTEFIPEEVVDRFRFREEDNRVIESAGGHRARAVPLGIMKASLSTASFSSAASFRETTRVSPKPPSTARWTTCAPRVSTKTPASLTQAASART